MEAELVNDGFLLRDLVLDFKDLTLVVFLFLLELVHLLDRESNLDQLEENLEVAEEEEVLLWLSVVGDFISDVTSLSSLADVNSFSHGLKISLVESFRLTLSDVLTISFIVSKQGLSLRLVRGASLTSQNLHDGVKNILHGCVVHGILSNQLFDSINILLVSRLDILVLLLLHALDQSFKLSNLGRFIGKHCLGLGELIC